MPNGLIPRSFWELPISRASSLWEDLMDETRMDTIPSGLSISEDDKNFYVSAALPGIDPKEIEVTFDRGILHISGQSKEEEKGKKVYKKATSSFSYHVTVADGVDTKKEPEVTYKNGMMQAVFKKTEPSKLKRIEVKVA